MGVPFKKIARKDPKYEFQMAYKKKGPVLYVESVEKTGAPKEEMVFF